VVTATDVDWTPSPTAVDLVAHASVIPTAVAGVDPHPRPGSAEQTAGARAAHIYRAVDSTDLRNAFLPACWVLFESAGFRIRRRSVPFHQRSARVSRPPDGSWARIGMGSRTLRLRRRRPGTRPNGDESSARRVLSGRAFRNNRPRFGRHLTTTEPLGGRPHARPAAKPISLRCARARGGTFRDRRCRPTTRSRPGPRVRRGL
jgi:hypothetical protein